MDQIGCVLIKLKRRIMVQDGVISILLLILLPIMIIGCVYTYRLLSEHATENKAHKIAYACSEAYLSRNNSYLYDNFGMIATLDSDSLEKSVQYYFERNHLIESVHEFNVSVTFSALSDPMVFKDAAIDAASTVVLQELLSYSIGLLDQLEIADKIRAVNKTLQNEERKLSEQLDQSGATEILKRVATYEDVVNGKEDVTALMKYLDEKHQKLYLNLSALRKLVDDIKSNNNASGFSVNTFVNQKIRDWDTIEAQFLEQYRQYSSLASDLTSQFDNIEADQIKLNEMIEELESVDLASTNPEMAMSIENLQTEVEIYKNRVKEGINAVKQMVNAVNGEEGSARPSLIDMLTHIGYEIESLMSGVEIGNDELVLKDEFGIKASEVVLSLSDKILLNEYFIAVFSSYDVNCPRKMGFRGRLTEKRLIKGEIEYLLSGEPIEKKSISNIRIKLFAMREAANIGTLISDSEKMRQISNATIALPQPWRTIAFSAFVAAWSSVESYADVNRLMKGDGFYYFKSKEQWATDFDTLLSGRWRTSIKAVPQAESESIDQSNAKMYYLDYLRVLLLIQSESEAVLRAMQLIACELDEISDGKSRLENFSRGHTIELIWNFGTLFNSKKTELQFKNEY